MRIDYKKYPQIGWLKKSEIDYDVILVTDDFYKKSQTLRITDDIIKDICLNEGFPREDRFIFLYNGLAYVVVFRKDDPKKRPSFQEGDPEVLSYDLEIDLLDNNKEETERHYISFFIDGQYVSPARLFINEDETGYKFEGSNKDIFFTIMRIMAFIKYAKIESRILNNTNKQTELGGSIYINDLSKKATVMDCTWYTNIFHTKGFGVRGHFRIQPIGEGKKERKIIWVNDFKKTRYIREARKLKEAV